MGRPAVMLLVLALLAGSAVAFAVAERLKLEKSPVAGTEVDKVFSPVCACTTDRARISFRLRKADRLTLSLLDASGDEVRTLVDHERYPRGRHEFVWDGSDDEGRIVVPGRYRPKVELGRADRTIVLPNPIRVDLTRPVVSLTGVRPRAISPDGDGFGDVVRVRFRLSERARPVLLVNGRPRVQGKVRRSAAQLQWFGSDGGRRLPPGTYRLALRAEDLAGNRSRTVPVGLLEIRYVRLGERRLEAVPGAPVRVAVEADAPHVAWVLRRGSSVVDRGTARRVIRFRAPERRGRYLLTAEAAGHRARAVLRVVARRR